MRLDLLDLRRNVFDRTVDLAGTETRVDGCDDVAHRFSGFAEKFQALHERDHPGVGVPILAKVEMPAVLAAEDDVLFSHRFLDERMPDLRADRNAAVFLD